MAKERIQKLIAAAGVMSRRHAEAAILAGRVSLNGAVVTELGTQADLEVDQLQVDGLSVQKKTQLKTFILNKPRGYVTTKHDDRGRRTVMDFFKQDPSLNPVGRLDFESEGLLLMTHDGDLLLRLTHPRYGIQKVYEVSTEGAFTDATLATLVSGVSLDDGVGKFDSIEKGVASSSGSLATIAHQTFLVTVSEGRNRFIRRMFKAIGLEVKTLKRIQLGPIKLGALKLGEIRELTPSEWSALSRLGAPDQSSDR